MNQQALRDVIGWVVPYRRAVLITGHVVLLTAAYFLAFMLRFEFSLPLEGLELLGKTLPFLLLVRVPIFAWFHLYDGLWRYVGMRDILGILKAVTLSSGLFLIAVVALLDGFPPSIFILDWVLCLAFVGGGRLALRAFGEWKERDRQVGGSRAIIVGAGDAAEMLIREIRRSFAVSYEVVGFVDDDPKKHGCRIHGVEVLGAIDQLPHLCRSNEVQQLLIAIPSVARGTRRRILERCHESGVPFKTVPTLNDLLQGNAQINQLQEVRPEDLLGREAVRLDLEKLTWELRGRRILVTGAAGSIGSELCRQLAPFEPEMLILFDRAESSLYFVDIELRRASPALKVVPVIGDILDRSQVEGVIRAYAPDILYHAAAYKHVPLVEDNPLEGITNNVFGTETVAVAAQQGGVKKFVFISTDKAVRPVGVMGMTKRIAEGLLQVCNGGMTTFVAVRFGNVLGSDGSVLPLFQWQIAKGGPVTVTDPEASRYFMLLSEAAQLVLQAGAMGKGGEVFFLDMGEPIRILELAQNLVRLSGLEPQKDIRIELTGLRPGERLKEVLVTDEEDLLPTEHEKVFMVWNHGFNRAQFTEDLEKLRRLVVARNREEAVAQIQAMAARY